MYTSSLPIVDKFLRSVVVLTVSTVYQKRGRTPGPSRDKFSRPDHIFVGLGLLIRREGHTQDSTGNNSRILLQLSCFCSTPPSASIDNTTF